MPSLTSLSKVTSQRQNPVWYSICGEQLGALSTLIKEERMGEGESSSDHTSWRTGAEARRSESDWRAMSRELRDEPGAETIET